MKKTLLTLLAVLACLGLRAQSVDVINTSGCAVLVNLTAFEPSGSCKVVGATAITYIPSPYSASWGPSTFAYTTGGAYQWGNGCVSVTNPGPGYEYGTCVGDNSYSCGSVTGPTVWVNPTCSMSITTEWVPVAVSPTGNAQLKIY